MMTNNVKVSVSCNSYNRPSLSLLQGEEVFANRILSRSEDSKGFSSRVYYLDGAGSQVPFEWEARPGQPKVVPEESCPPPPLSPPPAILSSILAKEQRHTAPSKPGSKKNRFWKKRRKAYNYVESSPADSSGLRMYDGDSVSSPRFSTSSSSSSSSSASSSYSSKCPSPLRKFYGTNFPPPAQLGNIKRRWGIEDLDWVLACIPWKPSGDHGFAARNHDIGCSM